VVSRKRAPDNILPRTVIKLPLRDGNQPSIKLECVIFRVEILDAEVILFGGSQRCGELFDFGALRGVALHWYLALTALARQWPSAATAAKPAPPSNSLSAEKHMPTLTQNQFLQMAQKSGGKHPRMPQEF
jgi:hypothetical protein